MFFVEAAPTIRFRAPDGGSVERTAVSPVSPVRFLVPDGEASFFDVAQTAAAEQMFVVHNGKQMIVCSVVPVGWKKVWVKRNPGPVLAGKAHSGTVL